VSVAVATSSWHAQSWSEVGGSEAANSSALWTRLSLALPLALWTGLSSSGAPPRRRRQTEDQSEDPLEDPLEDQSEDRLVSEDGKADASEASGAPGDDGLDEFGELFRAYRSDVERVCRRMLGESGGPDAASEVFLRAKRALASYDNKRPFRPWLLGIASHHCIDQLRRHARERRLFDAKDLAELGLTHPGPSPLRQLADTEQRREILSAVDALPRKYRLPLVLRYFEELDYRTIAELLGIERPQVGTLLFRAKRQLRAALSGGEWDPES